MRLRLPSLLVIVLCRLTPALAGPAAEEPILPPAQPWAGESRSLVVPDDHPWITPAEKSRLTRTPRYDETVAWLNRLVEAAPELRMVSIGRSPEGRDIWMVIASRDRSFTAEGLRAGGRPTLLAQAGIHAGEIDGKDAGLMLLRDMTVRGTKRDLLDAANLLFVPIFNVDGHERFGPFTRINQRGPVEAGWRVTSRRLNLNRDYAKLDAPETRAMVRTLALYDPDLYLDLHVTDGLDYQYDVTFGSNGVHGTSRRIGAWLDRRLAPAVERDLRAMGHIPGPLIFPLDPDDLSKGIAQWTSSPRYSTGYGDLRHLPTVLVETHSLKPYEQRVLGTYVLLESCLRNLGREARALRRAVAGDSAERRPDVPLLWAFPKRGPGEGGARPEVERFLMVEQRLVPSAISGGTRQEFTGRAVTMELPVHTASRPEVTVRRPAAYWIPPAWDDVIERLGLHGIRMERIEDSREVEVEVYRIEDPKLAGSPFEGRVPVTGTPRLERRKQSFPPGSVRVPTDQPLGDLAVHLLEPAAPDSFFQWGFFLEALDRVEYVEGYVMDPMADRMLAGDPALRSAFEKRLREDKAFAADGPARLQWFYEKTPFFDRDWNIHPVARE